MRNPGKFDEYLTRLLDELDEQREERIRAGRKLLPGKPLFDWPESNPKAEP